MAFLFSHANVLTLTTPEDVVRKAREITDLGGSETEREDKERRKKHLKEKLLAGEQIAFIWAIGHVNENLRRVNGQHSSEVFLARDPHPDWPTAVKNRFTNKRNPNDTEVFATCLRLFASHHKGAGRVETFEKLREATPKEVAQKIWPLPKAAAALV